MDNLSPIGYACSICFRVYRLKKEVKLHKETHQLVDRSKEKHNQFDFDHDDDPDYENEPRHKKRRKNVDARVIKKEEDRVKKSHRKQVKVMKLEDELSNDDIPPPKVEKNSSKSNDYHHVQQVNRCHVCPLTFRDLGKFALHLNRHKLPVVKLGRKLSKHIIKNFSTTTTTATTTTTINDDGVNSHDNNNNWESISSDESGIFIGKQVNNRKRIRMSGDRKRKENGESKRLTKISDNDDTPLVSAKSTNEADETVPVMKRSKTKIIRMNNGEDVGDDDDPPSPSTEVNNTFVQPTKSMGDAEDLIGGKSSLSSMSGRRDSTDTFSSRTSNDSTNANFDLFVSTSRRLTPKVRNTTEERITNSCAMEKHQKKGKSSMMPTKRHICRYCPNTFTNLPAFTSHQKIHEAEMPYVCRFCDCRFDQFNHRLVHERIHGGQAGSLTR